MKFQRAIGPVSLLFAGISSVIGSGWLFGPLFAAQIAGPAALLSWIIGGVLMMVIALTFAELGSAFPVAGGMIQYAQYSHGPLLSFLIGWMVWISSVAVAPVETLGIIQYAANYIPSLMNNVQGEKVLSNLGIFISACVMLLMCILNYYGAKAFSRSNNIITLIKLIVPISTAVILLSIDFRASNFVDAASGGFLANGWHGVFAALPLGGVIYSFIGSNTVLQLAGETKNPHRSIPFALIGTMVFCIVIYSLLQTAFIGALPVDSFSNGWRELHFAGDNGPFSGLMASLGLAWFVIIIYADAMISPFGTGFVFTASTARVAYGLSEIGFLPAGLRKLTQQGVPARCIALNYCVGLLLFLPFPGWQKLVSFIISCFIISYIVGPIALVGLRKIQPNTHRPFMLPYANAIALLAFYICNLLIFWTGWETVWKMMLVLSIGIVFFAFHCYQEKENVWLQQWKKSWWVLPYFSIMALFSALGSFGHGLNWLTFGWDFVAIAILTCIIFTIAIRFNRLPLPR